MLTFGEIDPALVSAQAELAASVRPLVNSLSPNKSFISSVVFVADTFHTESMGTYAHTPAPGRSHEETQFTEKRIEGHRVALHASTLGSLAVSDELQRRFHPSRMNPNGHTLFSIRETVPHEDGALPAVLQLAFHKTDTKPVEPSMVLDTYNTIRSDYTDALNYLVNRVGARESLADRSLLLPPDTHNAVVLVWDTNNSTRHANNHFTATQLFIEDTMTTVGGITGRYGGEVIGMTGDGQKIAFWLPESLDPNDTQAVQAYYDELIQSVQHDMQSALHHSTNDGGPSIRIAHRLGYLQRTTQGDTTGLVLFEIGNELKHQRRVD